MLRFIGGFVLIAYFFLRGLAHYESQSFDYSGEKFNYEGKQVHYVCKGNGH